MIQLQLKIQFFSPLCILKVEHALIRAEQKPATVHKHECKKKKDGQCQAAERHGGLCGSEGQLPASLPIQREVWREHLRLGSARCPSCGMQQRNYTASYLFIEYHMLSKACWL